MKKIIFSNWANNTSYNKHILYPKNLVELKKIIKINKNNIGICGNFRSFGDSCINKKKLISLKEFKKELVLDKKNSHLLVSSNTLLLEILKKIVPENFMLSVTPGSKYVTIGGMVSHNVIGKNNKKNQLKFFIKELTLLTPQNKIIKCSNKKNKEYFNLTVGGFGLTGTILYIKLKLKKVKNQQVDLKILKFNSLNEFKKISLNKNEFSVAWIDSHSLSNKMFKGLFNIGNYNKIKKVNENFDYNDKKMNLFEKIFLNFYIKSFFFSKLINLIYFYLKPSIKTVSFNKFFYPQDRWLNFNQCYKKGMFQIQILIPNKKFRFILNEISIFLKKYQIKSTFIILKKINEDGQYLNFFGKGYSLSFDFDVNENYEKIRFFFNNLINDNSLKINLSKDSLIKQEILKRNSQYKKFTHKINLIDKNKVYNNELSKRLKIKSERS